MNYMPLFVLNQDKNAELILIFFAIIIAIFIVCGIVVITEWVRKIT